MSLPGFRQNEQNKCKLCDGTAVSDFTGKGLEIFVVEGCELLGLYKEVHSECVSRPTEICHLAKLSETSFPIRNWI